MCSVSVSLSLVPARIGEGDRQVTGDFTVETVGQCLRSEMRVFGADLKCDVAREAIHAIQDTMYDTVERPLKSKVEAMEDACRRVERAAESAMRVTMTTLEPLGYRADRRYRRLESSANLQPVSSNGIERKEKKRILELIYA